MKMFFALHQAVASAVPECHKRSFCSHSRCHLSVLASLQILKCVPNTPWPQHVHARLIWSSFLQLNVVFKCRILICLYRCVCVSFRNVSVELICDWRAGAAQVQGPWTLKISLPRHLSVNSTVLCHSHMLLSLSVNLWACSFKLVNVSTVAVILTCETWVL